MVLCIGGLAMAHVPVRVAFRVAFRVPVHVALRVPVHVAFHVVAPCSGSIFGPRSPVTVVAFQRSSRAKRAHLWS